MSAGIVTNQGLANVMWAWTDPAVYAYPRTIQFGTGSGQGVSATALAAPAQAGVAAVVSQETTNVTGDTARYTATVTADEDRTITEVGVIDVNSLMEVYGDFDAITLANGDSIVFQINVTVSQV